MFKGFNVASPEYEVITPHTKLSYTVRSLNVGEEERLKGSLLSKGKISEHLNKCIYESLVSKPDCVTDYKSFLNTTTLRDRDALLFGLYHITYEEIRNYILTCPHCQKENKVTVKASNMFNYNPYPDDDILTKTVAVKLPITTGVTVHIHQPTLADEDFIIKNVNTALYPLDRILQTLIITKFEQDNTDSLWDDKSDIIDAYSTLKPRDKKAIYDAYLEEFGKYGIELKMHYSCQFCGHSDDTEVDLVDNFFRMVLTA